MRWSIFAIFAYLFIALQIGLGDLFEIQGVRPELLFIFMIFIAALAPSNYVFKSAILLGLLSDLFTAYLTSDQQNITIIGPHALGYALGAVFALQLRTMLFRQHPVSITLMVFLAGLTSHLTAIFLISVRWLLGEWLVFWPAFNWSPTDQLVERFLMILYTTIMTIPIAWILLRMMPLFAFDIRPRYLHTSR